MEIRNDIISIFEGGGAKGFAYSAVIEKYNELGYRPRNIMGVSAGSFAAVFLGLGLTPSEFDSIMGEKVRKGKILKSIFSTFNDKRKFKLFSLKDYSKSALKKALENIPILSGFFKIPVLGDYAGALLFHFYMRLPIIGHIYKESVFGGIYSGEKMRKWMLKILQERLEIERPTMQDFYEKTGTFLIICATDLDIVGNKFLVLTPESAPNLPVDVAVSMSAAIPGYYEFRRWQSDFGRVRKNYPVDITGHRIVDGGLVSNAPIAQVYAWDNAQLGEIPTNGNIHCFVLDETIPVQTELKPDTGKFKRDLNSFSSFATEIFNAGLSSDEIVLSSEKVRHQVCRLPAMGYGALDFDMSEQRKTALITSAKRAIDRFFNTNSEDNQIDNETN